MDWPKIKSILIIVLLITNVMLAYTNHQEKLRFEAEKENNIEDVIKLYENRDVNLNLRNFDFPKSIKSVNIDFMAFDMSYVDALLGNDYVFDGEKYISGDYFVLLEDTRIVYALEDHYNRIVQDELPSLTKFSVIGDDVRVADLKGKVDTFLLNGGYKNEYGQIEMLQLGHYSLVKLHQFHNAFKFEESKSFIWFYDGEIVGFTRENAVNISTTAGSKYDIISIDRILYGLLPKLQANDTLVDISIIYKLNDASLLVTNLVLGEALPYYRIVLESGDEYHVRAVVNF